MENTDPTTVCLFKRDARTDDPRRTPGSLWAIWADWVLASVAGAVLGGVPGLAFCYSIAKSLFGLLLDLDIGPSWASWGTIAIELCIFCCALGGALGLAQGLVLQRISVRDGRWIVSTLLGFLLALVPILVYVALGMINLVGAVRLLLDVLFAVLAAGFFGFGQQLGFPRAIREPRAWIIACILSWLVLPFALAFTTRLLPGSPPSTAWPLFTLSQAIFAADAMLTAGVAIGGATGISLLIAVNHGQRLPSKAEWSDDRGSKSTS